MGIVFLFQRHRSLRKPIKSICQVKREDRAILCSAINRTYCWSIKYKVSVTQSTKWRHEESGHKESETRRQLLFSVGDVSLKVMLLGWAWCSEPLIPVLEKQRQADLWEWTDSLGYITSFEPASAILKDIYKKRKNEYFWKEREKNMLFFVTCPVLDTSLNLGSKLSPDDQDVPAFVSYAISPHPPYPPFCILYVWYFPLAWINSDNWHRRKDQKKKILNQLSFLPR